MAEPRILQIESFVQDRKSLPVELNVTAADEANQSRHYRGVMLSEKLLLRKTFVD